LCTYPFLRLRRLLVPLLQRVTLEKRQSNQSAFAPFVRCLAQARHALAPVLLRGPAAIHAGLPTAQNLHSASRWGVHRQSQSEAAYRPAYPLKRTRPPVGASSLAMDPRAPRLTSKHALSLTTIASKLAPTGAGYTRALHHSSGRALARLQLLILIHPPLREAEWRCSSGEWRAAPFDAVEHAACRS
jgi:hypothetical protein